jgi:hypothetical protein
MFKVIVDAVRMTKIRSERKYLCCRLAWNLEQQPTDRADLLIETCCCGRTHRVMKAHAGNLTALGTTRGR